MKLIKKTLSVVLAVMMIASVCVISASAAETVTFGSAAVEIVNGKAIVPGNAVYYTDAEGTLYFPGEIIDVTAGDTFTVANVAVAAEAAFSYRNDDTVGIRAKAFLTTAEIEAADEIGFCIVPVIAPDLAADWYETSAYTLKKAIDKAAVYNATATGNEYQVCLKGLTDAVKSEAFLFAVYKTVGTTTTYAVIGAQSFNSIPRDMDISAILAAGAEMEQNVLSGYEVEITGEITSVDNATYGNVYVEDELGNSILVYGLYDPTGTIRYDAMETKPKTGDIITVKGQFKNYNGTVELVNAKLLAHTVTETEVTIYEGAENILTAAYALESGALLSDGHAYTLTGTIISIDDEYSSQYGNITVTIVCDGLTAMPIQCFRLKGVDTTQTALIGVNDVITVTGSIINYNGTIEFNSGCTFTDWVDNADPEPEVPDVPVGSEVVFEFGDNGTASHNDGSEFTAGTSFTSGDYTLTFTAASKAYKGARDAKGNSCIKLGTSKVVGSFSFEVPEEVDSVVIMIAKYKANTSKITVNGTAYTLTKASNNGEYDQIIVDTSTTKTVTLTTVSGGVRAMVNSISYVIGE